MSQKFDFGSCNIAKARPSSFNRSILSAGKYAGLFFLNGILEGGSK